MDGSKRVVHRASLITMVLRQMMVIHRMVRSTILILAILPLVAVFLRYHFVSNDAAQSLQNIGHGNEWEANTDANASLWEVLSGDDRVSVFVDVVKKFDDIVLALSNPRAKFTIYAPVNEAFAAESFPLDLPWFYWKLLAGYHMGPGAVSEAEIATSGTVPSYVNADIFFESMQRISVQRTNARPSDDSGSVTLNHRSRFTVREIPEHHLDIALGAVAPEDSHLRAGSHITRYKWLCTLY